VQPPDFGLFTQWYETSGGMIRMITVAPEVEGAIEFIEKVSALGVVCAIGHTAADGQTISRAVDAGARLSTHLGNGSHASLPRLDNYIWEQAAEDRLWASLICDGYHLPPAAVKVLSRAKGLDRLLLIGDSTGLTGRPAGRYRWGETETEIAEDGHITLAGTPYLAGAGFLLDWDLPRFMEYTGSSLGEAIRLCTADPRSLLGEEEIDLRAGSPAHLTLFRYRPDDWRLRITGTVIGSEELYAAEQDQENDG
jgi:N-acetylglucosamine-6-phosphate deacetylase